MDKQLQRPARIERDKIFNLSRIMCSRHEDKPALRRPFVKEGKRMCRVCRNKSRLRRRERQTYEQQEQNAPLIQYEKDKNIVERCPI